MKLTASKPSAVNIIMKSLLKQHTVLLQDQTVSPARTNLSEYLVRTNMNNGMDGRGLHMLGHPLRNSFGRMTQIKGSIIFSRREVIPCKNYSYYWLTVSVMSDAEGSSS